MSSDEDLERRFRELIRAEFGDVAGARLPGEAEPAPWSPPPRRRFQRRPLPDPIEYFNLSQAIEETEPDDDFERWNPPVDARLPRPPLRGLLGAVLVLGTMLLGVMVLAGWRSHLALGLILVSGGIGLGLLLSTIPRHRDIDGDGAQL